MQPPPPPPIPPPISVINITTCNPNKIIKSRTFYEDELNKKIERESACVAIKVFQNVQPIIQNGPTCGMVALAMATPDGQQSVEDITRIAKERGWSNMGEMYSCEWMGNLSQLYGFDVQVIDNGLHKHLKRIYQCLDKGGFVLVPYDKDKDFTPGLLDGTSAHWALVTGFLYLKKANTESGCHDINVEKIIDDLDEKFSSYTPEILFEAASSRTVTEDPGIEGRVNVTAFQGSSSHVDLWSFLRLATSNLNLRSIGPSREGKLKLPSGGIIGGLCGQAVLLMPPSDI